MTRPIVKYLDPVSGGYEFATVVDIGDLRNLNTTIKSDIVGAINSIISDGVHNPINDEKIENLEGIINSLKDGTFKIDEFGSIDEHLKQQFLDELDKINAQNRTEIQSVLTQLDTSVNDAIQDYQEKVAAQNIILENAENTLADARDTLEAKAAELETANIGLSELKTDFNELDGYISTNIRTIDFDNFNAMVEDYETVVTQTSDEVGVDMSGSTLSYLTGRVTDAEANISAQADEITSKMSYDEFQYMPVPKYSYGENLLFDTFDFGDAWSGKNGAQVTPDTFLFGKVVAFNSPTGLYETLTDDLTIGESYVFSTYVNVQPSEKSPSQDRYEPISKSYDPTDFKIQIGGKSFNPGVYEDLSGINGWVRINQEFVADAVNPIISVTPTGVNSQSEVAYMAMPKVEKGLTVTPWQPHVEDNYATISSTQSMIKQQANSITAFVTEVSELDDSYKQATSTFKMLADGFAANTEAVEAYEDAVTRYGTEYSNINGKFEQKVWKDDFKTVIEDINIDNRNRVLNSDFIRSEISSSDRRLIVEDWSLNSDWEIKTIDNDEYLSRNRTGLSQNLITSASSNYFPVRDGERILFGFDLIHSGLDSDKVFSIELFDINDKRLLKQEFSLSSLTKVGNRYHGSFNISTPGAEKGSVVLQLPRNGSLSFTKISFQNADIGSVDWSPAPEDSWIIQSKLATYISQVEDEITIGGTGQKIDTLTGLLTEDKGTFTLNPDKIATEVLNSQTYDDMGFVNKTNFEQTADGWMQEITSEGRLAGYINASPDTYRISFDKIMLEGTTWADALGSSNITVTENFALLGEDGVPVLDVNKDGSVNMNVSTLKVSGDFALTSGDKKDIEKEVTDNVIKTTEPYVHIAYADTEDGQGLSFNPSGKQYIGFAKSHLPKPSGTVSNYEWSKYVGADGYEGVDGVGIESTTIRYASSTSGTNQPSTGWSSGIPYVETGNYLWTEIVWKYTNNEERRSYTVARIGKDGVDGLDGIGITSTRIEYTNHTSGTDVPSEGWQETIPDPIKGQYQWTRTVVGYTEGKPSTSYSVSYIPTNGQRGPDGNGVESTSITYAQSLSGTVTPSDWSDEMPEPEQGQYIWTKTVITYTDNSTSTAYSTAYSAKDGAKGDKGDDGYTPIKGVDYFDGNDGVSIVSVKEYYLTSDKDAGITITGYDWKETIQPISETQPYLWNYERIEYSNGLSDTFGPNIIGRYATDGEKGEAGRGIASIAEYYLASPENSGVIVRGNKDWSTTFQQTTPTNRYLWNYEEITYTDGLTDIIGPSIIGTHGMKGDSPIVAYLTNDSHMIPADADGLNENYENAYTEMRVMDGIEDDTDSYKFSAEESSGIVGKIEGNKYTVTSLSGDLAEVKITATKGSFTINKVFTVAKSKQGFKGQDGQDSLIYQLETDSLVLTRDVNDTLNPRSINIQSISMKGNEPKKPFSGYFRVYEQHTSTLIPDDFAQLALEEGVTEEAYILSLYDEPRIIRYESIFKESSLKYEPRVDAVSVYIQLYADDSFSEVLDSQTVMIVSHGMDGKDGVSVLGVTEYYLASELSSGVKATSEFEWSTSIPETNESKPFLWNYETTQLSNGTSTNPTEPVIIGRHSVDGVSITGVTNHYALGESNVIPPTSGWSETPNPTNENNRYLWNYETITYSKGQPTDTKKVVIGTHGAKGSDGVGVDSTVIEYGVSTGQTSYPTKWYSEVPSVVEGQFLWTKTVWHYTNNDVETAYSVSKIGKDGYTPVKGKDYDDGISITGVEEKYKLSHLKEGETTSGVWANSPELPTRQKPYLWNYEVISYSKGEPTITKPVVISVYSADGTSVHSIKEYYALSTTTARPSEASFTEGIKVTDDDNKYLWNKEVVTLKYDDGTTKDEPPHYAIIGTHGARGYTPVKNVDYFDGDDGVGIESTVVEYQASSNGTVIPASTWSESIPSVDKGQYLWTRTKWIYTNKDEEYAYSVSYEGKDGSTGGKGDDGVGISKTTIDYQASANNTMTPTGTWLAKVPSVPSGQYLWTRTTWDYTNGDKKTAYSVSRIGKDGVSITSVVEKYKLSTLAEGETTSGTWDNTPKAPNRELPYLWNYEIINYSEGNPTVTKPAVISMYSADGTSIVNIEEFYALSTTTTRPAESLFTKTMKVTDEFNKYLWNKEVITLKHDNGTTTPESSYAIIGVHGETGSDGVGISSTVVEYSVSSSGTTVPTSGWGKTVPTTNPGQYLWTRTAWTYTNNDVEYAYSVAYEGKNGSKGNDGVGIASTIIDYTSSTSGTAVPTGGWNTKIPTVSAGSFLWTRTRWTYTNGDTETGYSVSRAAKDGVSIVSVVEKYKLSTLLEGETTAGVWGNNPKAPTRDLPYLWNYEIINYSSGSPTITTPAVIGMYSADGTSIVDIKEYYALSSTTARPSDDLFTEAIKFPDEDNKYLWNKEVIILKHDDGKTTPEAHYAIIGVHGNKGDDGKTTYTWIQYSANSTGVGGMYDTPQSDTKYIGIATNKDTSSPSKTPRHYTWSKFIGDEGPKGSDAIVAILTNENHTIPADEDGLVVVESYRGANTEIKILEGATDITSTFVDITAIASDGVTGSLSGNKYTVTEIDKDTDTGEVTLTAKKGSTVITKVFTITKSKKGIKGTDGDPGDDSVLYQLNTDTLVVIKDIDDVYSQDSVSLTSVMKVGLEDYTNNPVYFRVYEQKVNPLTVDTFSELSMKDQVDNREYILSLYGKPRLLQYESFMKESHIDYNLGKDIMSIFVEIYEDENFTKIIDSQSIAVIAEPKPNYKLEMHSTNGNGFLNGVINTEMYVTLYRGEDDITDSTDAKHFIWTRVSSDTNSDTAWNNKYKAGAKSIIVTKDDVNVRARFSCNFVK